MEAVESVTPTQQRQPAAREGAVSLIPVRSRRHRRAFLDFPYRLYADNPHYVPQLRMDVAHALDPRKNPFFEHGAIQCFLAMEGSDVVGRIAAIRNGMHLKKYDDDVGFFGFFECIEKYDVASDLLDAARAWLEGHGLRAMRGPTNPTMNDICGLLVGTFDRKPSIMMPYNPPYYVDYLERYGFTRAMTMWAYFVHDVYVDVRKLERGVNLVKRRNPGISVRKINMDAFESDARVILDIYNDAWSDNWGHVPMTQNEFKKLAKELKQIVDPNLVFFLEDDGKPIAFSVSLPNLNQALVHAKNGRLLPFGLAKILLSVKLGAVKECRNLLMGVLKAYRSRGLDAILIHALITEGRKAGYQGCEMSWVLDENKRLINALDSLGGSRDKEYGMYELSFENVSSRRHG